MSVVVVQKSFMPEELPDIQEPPRWPGKSQGSKTLPKMARLSDSITQRKKVKTISEISEIVSDKKEHLQLLPRKELSELTRKHLHIRPPDVPFHEYKIKRNIRERPMSEITIPPEWSRRKWDVAPIEGPFNIPSLKKKSATSPGHSDSNTDIFTSINNIPLLQPVHPETSNVPLKLRSLPPPPDMFGTRSPIVPPRAPVRRQRIRPLRRPRSAQLPLTGDTVDVWEGLIRPQTDMSRKNIQKYNTDMVAGAALSEPGWGDRTVDKRFLEDAARQFLNLDTVNFGYCFYFPVMFI